MNILVLVTEREKSSFCLIISKSFINISDLSCCCLMKEILLLNIYMSHVVRKPVFVFFFYQVKLKLVYSATETS